MLAQVQLRSFDESRKVFQQWVESLEHRNTPVWVLQYLGTCSVDRSDKFNHAGRDKQTAHVKESSTTYISTFFFPQISLVEIDWHVNLTWGQKKCVNVNSSLISSTFEYLCARTFIYAHSNSTTLITIQPKYVLEPGVAPLHTFSVNIASFSPFIFAYDARNWDNFFWWGKMHFAHYCCKLHCSVK